ncbi:MBL fold metallo-hydrolase [Paludibacterium purpuratum]|uniref:Glyoxylase-like metal-dependent hydrolase (Beta-lactamase superfamily II) n=1 Tax=Paludibacterium purpuratum TaxID=1144873 RepID=A0A4R7BAJ7_9NEIS|nr:MBL fold metallo-hydrolase [Paludibacterium purpuratum]TDR80686.1 glyoxylase-like metal-dependent hydrolase (beta-lactamase superfamily II) [Paludibacterium purpuratum]
MSTTIKTYSIGDAKITRVTDTLLYGLTPSLLYRDWHDDILSEQPHLRSLLDASGEQVILSVHTWVVEWAGKIFLIDTGIGNGKERPFSQLFHRLQTPYLARLAAVGIEPEDVHHVLLTHLHADHVGWNTRMVDGQWVPTFPNAKYVMPQGDVDFYATPAADSRRMVFDDSVAPVIAARQAIYMDADGGDYLERFRFHATPGHCAGHMAISFASRGEMALFTGDVVHTPIQVYRPEWNSVFCAEQEQARASRRWLLDFAAEQDATLFTAHFPDTSAGRVSRQGHGFQWQFV